MFVMALKTCTDKALYFVCVTRYVLTPSLRVLRSPYGEGIIILSIIHEVRRTSLARWIVYFVELYSIPLPTEKLGYGILSQRKIWDSCSNWE